MAVSKPAVAGGVAALGGGAAAGGIILSRSSGETIGNELKDELLDQSSASENWAKLVSVANGDTDNKNKYLKGITVNENSLKEWCNEKSSESSTEELLKVVKKWCVLTIKAKLDNKALDVEKANTEKTNKEDWKIKAWWLKEHQDKNELNEDLKTKQTSIKNLDSDWDHLRSWCKEVYQRGYKNEENKLWKLANKFCSKATIKEALYGTELPTTDEVKADWEKKVTGAKSATENQGAKDTTFKNSLSSSDSATDIPKVKTWCEQQYSKFHDAKETWGTSTPVIDEVKKWCVLLIKDKIDSGKTMSVDNSDETDKDEWKTKATSLKTNSTNLSLTPELTGVKTKITESEENWKELRTWCKGAYYKGYKGANDNLWKLADAFCKKQ